MKKSHKVGGGQRWFLEEVGPSEKVSLQLGLGGREGADMRSGARVLQARGGRQPGPVGLGKVAGYFSQSGESHWKG